MITGRRSEGSIYVSGPHKGAIRSLPNTMGGWCMIAAPLRGSFDWSSVKTTQEKQATLRNVVLTGT